MVTKIIFQNLLLLILASLCITGCGEDEANCTSKVESFVANVNTFDNKQSPSTPVALFTFSQESTFYSTSASCPSMSPTSKTMLSIQNTSGKIISVTYIVQFVLNAVSWQYQGAITSLPPGASTTPVQASTAGGRVDWGQFTIGFYSLSYN